MTIILLPTNIEVKMKYGDVATIREKIREGRYPKYLFKKYANNKNEPR